MTFAEIQTKVADRLNLTSAAALVRIGEEINERYRELASSVGLHTTARTSVTATTTIGNRNLSFVGQKVYSVYDSAYTPPRVLFPISMDQMRHRILGSDPPHEYAILLMGSSTVTIYLDCTPTTAYALGADVELNLTTLSGTNVPAFAEDFHDILVKAVMAEELEKMEKYTLAKVQEIKYEKRLSELRLFIAKDAYRRIRQGESNGV